MYFFKYNTEYEQYASNQIMYYYEMINEENQRINILPKEKLNAFFREDSIYCQKLLSDWKNDEDAKIIAKDMYDRDQNILKYIDSGMDLSNFKSILQNNIHKTRPCMSIPWWRSHPIHENRATESICTEPCNP